MRSDLLPFTMNHRSRSGLHKEEDERRIGHIGMMMMNRSNESECDCFDTQDDEEENLKIKDVQRIFSNRCEQLLRLC